MTEEKKENATETPTKSNRKPYKKADYKMFVKFYSMPTIFRQAEYGFKTEKEFAKEYDLAPDTLVDWKKRPEFTKDIDAQLAKWGADKTPDVLASLYRTILKEGKASEVKLWLQFIKNWKEGMIVERPDFDMASIAKVVRKIKEEDERKNNKSNA